jgi:hypothetical protein
MVVEGFGRRSRAVFGVLVALALVASTPSAAASTGGDEGPGLGDHEAMLASIVDSWGAGLDAPSLTSPKEPAAKEARPPATFDPRRRRGGSGLRLLAKAEPDECFAGPGLIEPPGPPCEVGQPKVNQAYVWGLAQSGKSLWWGTGPNVLCLVLGAFLGLGDPIVTDSYACEFGASELSPPVPPALGDFRPAEVYRYNTRNRRLVEETPDDPLFNTTLGMRSAGALDNIVMLGGPGLDPTGVAGINLFAFRPRGRYLGSAALTDFVNIRRWLAVDGVLYAGVQVAPSAGGGGAVLRFSGSPSDPFTYEVVGRTDTEVAELAVHEGRLAVTTWPTAGLGAGDPTAPTPLAGVYVSPVLPDGGLGPEAVNQWDKVWDIGRYEVDPATAAVSALGAVVSDGEWAYWGTMHVPGVSTLRHFGLYGLPETPEEQLVWVAGSLRAISIYRGKNLGTADQQVELLYGNRVLPVYDPDSGWSLQPNGMGAPRYGPAGFGNPFNNYTWTGAELRRDVYLGTMDWSYLLPSTIAAVAEQAGTSQEDAQYVVTVLRQLLSQSYGADLWRFPAGGRKRARPVNIAGLGNYTNYGLRSSVVDKRTGRIYFGTANAMNLLTDPDDDLPEGGWELWSYRPQRDKRHR